MKKEEIFSQENGVNVEKSLMEEMNEVSGVDMVVEREMKKREKRWSEEVDWEKVMKCRVRWKLSGILEVGLEKNKLLYCVMREEKKEMAMRLVRSLEEQLKKGELK